MSEEQAQILIVEDEMNNLNVLMNHFREQSYDILYAKNGAEACEIANEELPDLILMDWAMPIMNGIQATLKLKSEQRTADIPIVMITGVMTTVEDLKEALAAGAADYIRKPFDPIELTARVTSMLRLGKSFKEIKVKNLEINELLEKEKTYLEEQLGQKERELTLQGLHAMEKEKFMKDVYRRMIDVQGELADQVPRSFHDLTKYVKRHMKTDAGWESFSLQFEQVHPKFFKKLSKKYPHLTNNDLRLSAYVKIGMDNKEIARITGVETATVKTNLHRLKQKLGLNPDERVKEKIRSF